MAKHNGIIDGVMSGAYVSWRAMKRRCDYVRDKSYKHYGGRGIKYDQSWTSFEGFYKDMGDRPEGYTLDRIDTNGNYCKDNCRWATRYDQNRNKRETVLVEFEGEKRTFKEIGDLTGIRKDTLRGRYKKNRDLFKEHRKGCNAKKVIRDDGKIYSSCGEAAKDLDRVQTTIGEAIRRKSKCNGFYLKFLEEEG